MSNRRKIIVDGNEAVASVAHRTNEIIAIFPITPSSPMGEFADEWSALGKENIWGTVPEVIEMQSEAGAAGAIHGALQSGALSTTFTASQGLLLMIPNMYKIAGELTPFCMHVSARTLATHALSIFGDHSDVMACRQTGFALLASNSVQEAHDMACIAQVATLRSRVPFLHFFDGFRTSHEVNVIEELTDSDLRHMIDDQTVSQHRKRALTPDAPVVRGTAQNPDTFFQAQEARNPFYDACSGVVEEAMDRFAELAGRQYKLFDYVGHAEAEKIIVAMGSGAVTVEEEVERLNRDGEKVGLIKVRLYRPFSADHLARALPPTVRAVAVLDRTKEAGAMGEPLYQDVALALREAGGTPDTVRDALVIGGRYGLASKEFTPTMVRSIFDELDTAAPKRHFTVGITDDITGLSLPVSEGTGEDPKGSNRAVFFGLGSDGTVSANKNSIKIVAENTDLFAQGYFVYDSKKAGAVTISHLRFSDRHIQSPYLIEEAQFLACHHFHFLEKIDVLKYAAADGTFLLNASYPADQVWDRLPRSTQQVIIDKRLKVFVIDAAAIAREADLGARINTIMQTCFFAIANILPRDEAISHIKNAIEKTYGRKREDIVELNFAAVDATLAGLHEISVPGAASAEHDVPPTVPDHAPDFVKQVTGVIIAGKGDMLPVSAFPVDGTWPLDTAQWEKRNIAQEIPVWETELCIQCNKCALICPHAAIRVKVADPAALADAPPTFLSMDYLAPEDFGEVKYLVQVAPEDCTGCTLCVEVCEGFEKGNRSHRSLAMQPQAPLRESEKENWEFFLSLPEVDRSKIERETKMSQFAEPLFEFSGACLGCGETPYIKLVTQLYGDRAVFANATGCSSIYGGNLPTTPYKTNCDGRGPAWSNSLFEDNAEFGLGMRLAIDKHGAQARELIGKLPPGTVDSELVRQLLDADQSTDTGIAEQRVRVEKLRTALAAIDKAEARRLEDLVDYLVDKNVWIVGGDGWAYDIGYGGLDHVLATGANVNILVLDTEVYSNTGGQQSKATGLGAAAKFATAGKAQPKKDLGLMAIAYGNVYVASIAMGGRIPQTVYAIRDAESFDGPSLIIAYSPCGEHGYVLENSLDHQKLAVKTGYWPLYRYDPRRIETGEKPLVLESSAPRIPLSDLLDVENRFGIVKRQDPERYEALKEAAENGIRRRRAVYEKLAELDFPDEVKEGQEETQADAAS
ncbi:MAG: pyruvate:ferredoxin (flavodoxin) oxidoreductase [Rhodospirillales bacterium]|jgi:pyruvate-ferredoxin/flavodoxin oxidoreductase|nr:pyruvate:ferredoxin (flavodoxin) oxidoreductase [Rhodospirillales bacterium]MDP6644013.1 pyruvate:ferredoxin (flavodoxin) oxidoreductase [Rhodospirillales bacterium]MDP6841234.1 pyruvate:ferredoxin (flavodoxin) oxidoreductase [Rhodospirillales bacterium]